MLELLRSYSKNKYGFKKFTRIRIFIKFLDDTMTNRENTLQVNKSFHVGISRQINKTLNYATLNSTRIAHLRSLGATVIPQQTIGHEIRYHKTP